MIYRLSKIKYYIFDLMRLIRILAFPISLIYALVVYLRNWLFDIGLLQSKTFDTPLICIGNLSTGGTGKTPMTEFIISALSNSSKVAVLSRGYKRKSKGYLLATNNSTVEELGDEPYQIFTKFQNIELAVDANRRNGIELLEKEVKPDVIILDDAFQHRKVKPSLNILLTAYDDLYTDDWYLPTGNLRDGKKEAKRAEIIVVTKCPTEISDSKREEIKKRLAPKKHQQILFAHLEYDSELTSKNDFKPLNSLKKESFTLVTGIANPQPLLSYLEAQGLNFNHLKYNDHHNFSTQEVAHLNSLDLKVTTEKDYVRLSKKVDNLYYLGVRHKFIKNDEVVLRESLNALLK